MQPRQAKPTALIAEEHNLNREGLAMLCRASGLVQVVALVADGAAASQWIEEYRPDVAILDIGIDLILSLQAARSPTRAVVLAARSDRRTVVEVLRAGAAGLLLRSSTAAQLAACLDHVLSGNLYLPPEINLQRIISMPKTRTLDPLESLSTREHQVYTLLVAGTRPKDIAERLGLSPKTIDTHRASLMRKLDIHDLAGLVRYSVERSRRSAEAGTWYTGSLSGGVRSGSTDS
jgi:DNA-binding NarL/FixJ family response regulator